MRLYGHRSDWVLGVVLCLFLMVGRPHPVEPALDVEEKRPLTAFITPVSRTIPTRTPTSAPTPIPTIPTSPTPPTPPAPTSSPTITVTATPTATHTPEPTATPTVTPTATLIPTVPPTLENVLERIVNAPMTADISDQWEIDRTCIEPKWSAYNRDRVGDTVWPTPIARPRSHFMLDPAIAVGGNMVVSGWFPYGYDGGVDKDLHLHVGIDVMGEEGVPLLAPADGTIVFARSDKEELHGLRCNWYGQLVTILHDERWRGLPVYTLYGHVLNITVEEGQKVVQGDQVAEIGYGGAAYVAHLHAEVRVGENTYESTRNPLLWFKPPEGKGVVAGRLLNSEGKPWLGIPVYAVPAGYNLGSPPTRTAWSYLGDEFNIARPDDGYAENFVFGGLPAGEYTIMANPQGEWLSQEIRVLDGRVVMVEISTE